MTTFPRRSPATALLVRYALIVRIFHSSPSRRSTGRECLVQLGGNASSNWAGTPRPLGPSFFHISHTRTRSNPPTTSCPSSGRRRMTPVRTQARPMTRQSLHRRRGRPLVAVVAAADLHARVKREVIIDGSWRVIPVSSRSMIQLFLLP